jgi:hypothetical protein
MLAEGAAPPLPLRKPVTKASAAASTELYDCIAPRNWRELLLQKEQILLQGVFYPNKISGVGTR